MLIAMKLKVAVALVAIAGPVAVVAPAPPPDVSATTDNVVEVAPVQFDYRLAGEFTRDGRPVGAPLRRLRLDRSLAIMKRQVTAAEYAVCVSEGGCAPLAAVPELTGGPAVGVSWRDATAYAAWLSRKTGLRYRLPTDAEWVFAAAGRATDDALPVQDASDDPSKAWLARYDAESRKTRPVTMKPQPIGFFGANENGILDIAGNVWEWTDTCFVRSAMIAADAAQVMTTNCGVRVVQGAHRSYMTDFVRDPRTGGCAAGVPPANLGFRLVLEKPVPRWREMAAKAARLFSGAPKASI